MVGWTTSKKRWEGIMMGWSRSSWELATGLSSAGAIDKGSCRELRIVYHNGLVDRLGHSGVDTC
jgi:hypothetical protein